MHVLPGCGRHTVAHWCCRTRQGAATTAATHLGKSLIWLPAMQLFPCCHHFMSCCTSSDHASVGNLLAPCLAFVSMLFSWCHYIMSCIAPEAPVKSTLQTVSSVCKRCDVYDQVGILAWAAWSIYVSLQDMSAPGTKWSCLLHVTPVSKLRGCRKGSLCCNTLCLQRLGRRLRAPRGVAAQRWLAQ